MTGDQMFVMGAVLLILAIPAILSAFADGRPPRVALIALLVGGALIIFGMQKMPGGLALNEIPHVFLRVIAQVIN